MSKNYFVFPQQGLGDHLVCNGLYRSLAMKSSNLIIAVRKNRSFLENMLKDVENIHIQQYPNPLWKYFARAHGDVLINHGFKSINLGNFPTGFLEERRMKFDEGFYSQAGVDFDERWKSFKIPEESIGNSFHDELLKFREKKYIFLHEDQSRGMVIDRTRIPSDWAILSTEEYKNKLSFFEFIPLIKNAARIDCIESSFCALIEGLGGIDVPKIAHRYARNEARTNPSLEFTYKSNWLIYN